MPAGPHATAGETEAWAPTPLHSTVEVNPRWNPSVLTLILGSHQPHCPPQKSSGVRAQPSHHSDLPCSEP